MDWKKLIWRAIRGSVYTAVAGFLAVKLGAYFPPEVIAALAGGLLAAIDKALGFGALVKAAKT